MSNKRVPVTLTDGQHGKINKAAITDGLTISAFMRTAALEKARLIAATTRHDTPSDGWVDRKGGAVDGSEWGAK